MNLAVTIAGEQAPASAFVVWRGFEESIRKAGIMGYDGVELALKSEQEVDRHQLRQWLSDAGIKVSCITTGQVFSVLGLYLTHPDDIKQRETLDTFAGLIDLAAEFGGLVNIGRARGMICTERSRSETEERFIEAMQKLCDEAAPKGVSLLIEPVNRYENNFINSLDEGAALLSKVERQNCGLHADVFHMNIEDDRLGESIIRNGQWIKYIHLADSNRLAPGLGHLDFIEIFDALECIGYDSWASLEMLPSENPDQMVRSGFKYLKALIARRDGRKGAL